jgi:hypothetical protein
MDLFDQRKKRPDPLLLQLIDHKLFVPRTDVNGVPLRLGDGHRC